MKSFRRTRRDARLVNCQISQITQRPSLGLDTIFDREIKQKIIFFVQCTFKNEKELKGGIIACTQRAGILVHMKKLILNPFLHINGGKYEGSHFNIHERASSGLSKNWSRFPIRPS